MTLSYNLIDNFSIIACGAQHTLHAGIVRIDRELFHQIIVRVIEACMYANIFINTLVEGGGWKSWRFGPQNIFGPPL